MALRPKLGVLTIFLPISDAQDRVDSLPSRLEADSGVEAGRLVVVAGTLRITEAQGQAAALLLQQIQKDYVADIVKFGDVQVWIELPTATNAL